MDHALRMDHAAETFTRTYPTSRALGPRIVSERRYAATSLSHWDGMLLSAKATLWGVLYVMVIQNRYANTSSADS